MDHSRCHVRGRIFAEANIRSTSLETTLGQTDGFFSQLIFKCYLPEVASVKDWRKICPWVASRSNETKSGNSAGIPAFASFIEATNKERRQGAHLSGVLQGLV